MVSIILLRMRRIVNLRAALTLAVSILAGACASSGGAVNIPKPFPVPADRQSRQAEPATEPSRGNAVDDRAVVATALSFRGTPYRDGGSDPKGFDCSGFTQYVFARNGVALPRDVRSQFQQGQSIKPGKLAAGDLLFFRTGGVSSRGATHVAIAIDDDQFVHAPSSTGVVRVERLSAKYWKTRYLGARRVG
jgi:cell wall-associated NlpC family hydrolase